MATRRNQLITRARSIPARLRNRVSRLLTVEAPTAETHSAGADYATDSPVGPSYSVASSMSAMGAFPWVRACVLAKAEDLAGLPISVTRGPRGNRQVVDDHPVLDLLARPSTKMLYDSWLAQLVVDLELVGMAFQLQLGFPGLPSLIRLHPQRTEPIPDTLGQAAGFMYDGRVAYAWDDVMYIADPSWEDGPTSILGEGAIRSLHEGLTADLFAVRMAAKASERGRLEVMISPASDDQIWNDEQVGRIKDNYLRLAKEGHGVLVNGGAAKLDTLSVSPKEVDLPGQRELTRAEILAVFRVPPTRVGLPGANYATDRQQMRLYWEGLRARGRLIAGGLSLVAQRLSGDSTDRVELETKGVEALQTARTEAQSRVQGWVDLGATPREAAAYEGFADAPLPEELPELEVEEEPADLEPVTPDEEPSEEPAEAPEPEEPDEERSLLHPIGPRARAAKWRAWERNLHGPAERLANRATKKFLRAQKARTSKALARALRAIKGLSIDTWNREGCVFTAAERRGLVDDAVAQVMRGENLRTRRHFLPVIRRIVEAAFAAAADDVGVAGLVFDPTRSDAVAFTEKLVKALGKTTSETIRRIVNRGLDGGASIAEMQTSLQVSGAFAPSRALRIARTETTKAVASGTVQAYKEAIKAGVKVRQEWLTSRDNDVRDSHEEMDGQVRDVGDDFDSPSGASGPYPGSLGDGSEDINCRCTLIPVTGE